MDKKSSFVPQALFFGPEVFAGKGKMKKGIILALLRSIPIFGWVGVPIYSTIRAGKELDETTSFNWKAFFGVMVLDLVLLKVVGTMLPK